jgi:D-alanyl-D-alanine carboxypeptidase
MQEIRTQYGLPALVIGEGQPGKFASQAIGVRKEGNPAPALNTDIYHLGSNTKAMTATLLALIIQEGNLSWTTTLSEALPGFNISTAQQDTTLEMLTCHRSGITDTFLRENQTFYLSLFNTSAYEGRWAISNISLSRPPSNKKGTYTYANMNYVLAGLVIDVATKAPAEDMFQSRVFKPLDITTAGWGPTPETSDTSIDNP